MGKARPIIRGAAVVALVLAAVDAAGEKPAPMTAAEERAAALREVRVLR